MSDELVDVEMLRLLGVTEDRIGTVVAAYDQILAWEREHPGEDALASGECDDLFRVCGRAWIDSVR